MVAKEEQKQSSRFVRLFGYCINKLWLLIATIIILVALVHVLLNVFLPQIDRYQPEIVQWLEKRYQLKIEVEMISAEWSVSGPTLELTELKIKSNNQSDDFIEVGKVAISLDIITSLWNWRLSTEEIAIDNASITFRINQALGVDLPLTKASGSEMDIDGASAQVFDALFGQRALSLTDSSLKLITISGTEFSYHINQLSILKYDEIHQLSGQLENSQGGKIQLVTEVYGDPAKTNAYSEIYLQGEGIDISNLPWPSEAPVDPPTAGDLSWEFWGTWKDKHWAKASASVLLSNTLWSDSRASKTKNQFKTMLSWDHASSSDGFLSAHDSVVTIGETEEQSISNIFLKYTKKSNQAASWDLTMEEFELDSAVSYLASVIEHEDPVIQFISDANLSLKLDRFYIDISKKENLWQAPKVSINFSDLNYDRWNNIPRLNGLMGKILIASNGGVASIYAQDTQMELGEMFRHSIKVDQLVSLFSWSIQSTDAEPMESAEKYEQQIVVRMLNAKLTNEDLSVRAQAKWFTQDKQPMFSLYSELTNVDASNKSLYLPVGSMSSNLVDYLDRAIKSGTFPLIKSVVRGPSALFPFANEEGYFATLGYLKNATYQYLPDWPETTELDTKLIFVGNSMDIIASNANSMGNQLRYARAEANDLSIDNPILNLTFDVESSDNLGRSFLRRSPLSGLASSLAEIDFEGSLRAKVNMQMGLANSDSDKGIVNGVIQLKPDNANIKTPYINIENLDGEIKFDQESVLASSLTADYRGNKLSIEMIGRRNKDDPTLTINTHGVLTSDGVSDFLDLRWSQFFSGETQVVSNIVFSPKEHPGEIMIEVHSDMSGMAFELPDAIGKPAEKLRELSMSLHIGDESKGKIKWGEIFADWYWGRFYEPDKTEISSQKTIKENKAKAEGLVRMISSDVTDKKFVNYGANIFINDEVLNNDNEHEKSSAERPVDKNIALSSVNLSEQPVGFITPGISISGSLLNANLNGWIEFINRLNDEELIETQTNDDTENTPLLVDSINLDIDVLDINIANFYDAKISLSKALTTPWEIDLEGPQGKINLVLNELTPWKVTISKLELSLNEEIENSQVKQSSDLMPINLFDMDLLCEVCIIQEKNYGRILAEIRKTDEIVEFQGVASNKTKHDLVFSGTWKNIIDESVENNEQGKAKTRTSQDGTRSSNPTESGVIDNVHANSVTETTLNFELTTDDIGKLLERWDINPSVKDSSGTLVAEMKWQDAPWDFDYSTAEANMQLHLNRGYLSEISDGSGRLFSLFNLQSLIRKITFDFKDVYQKGFFYDSIDGTLQLQDGIISTENVSVVGNVADVRMYGKTNLKDETIEQMAIITPHLTSSLPVLAAWAIEPTTGLIVYIINKLMEPAVEVATQIDYRIHGTFDEVAVDQISSSKRKIKVEYETEAPTEDKNIDEQINSDKVSPNDENNQNIINEPEIKDVSKLEQTKNPEGNTDVKES
ncbi:MAG: hypothetical protein L3J46_02220 [Kangiellaceae bacterium]|nr:hypothetical protein [Kangiellaceae bacterium]